LANLLLQDLFIYLQREGVELDSCLSSRLPLNPTLFWSEKIPAIHWTTPSMLLGQRIRWN